MKGVDLFCASPASTAICSSMDQRSMVRRGIRPINHHNPYPGERRRSRPLAPVPCSSQLPISPKLHHQKSRKSSAKQTDLSRKSSSEKNDLTSPPGSSRYLLSDIPFFNLVPDSDSVSALVPAQTSSPLIPSQTAKPRRLKSLKSNDSPALVSSSSTRSHDQVLFGSLPLIKLITIVIARNFMLAVIVISIWFYRRWFCGYHCIAKDVKER